MMKYCVLNEMKICDECGECNRCDLDPDKICDNCCKCLDSDSGKADYAQIDVSDVVVEKAEEYLGSYFADENDEIEIPHEEIDPELLKEWEERLKPEKRTDLPPSSLHGRRKKRN